MPTMVLGEGPVMAFELRRWFLWYLHLRYHQSLTDKEKEVWITDKALTVVLVLRRRRFKLRYFVYNVGPNGLKNCQEMILMSLENKLDNMEIVLMCKLRSAPFLRFPMLRLSIIVIYAGVDEYRSHAGLNLQGLCKSWVGIGQHFYGQHPTRACTAKTRIDRVPRRAGQGGRLLLMNFDQASSSLFLGR
ncbi:hypothetical protein HID58_002215 [Brassica napus]|uniref:Uncharacterized protein n=1 Tax=Brassica napus TaxID=3708 RepID=A0ABQ8EPA8_BRANA|nr:hypothetical protein HID58_002215 [Brassica napus]